MQEKSPLNFRPPYQFTLVTDKTGTGPFRRAPLSPALLAINNTSQIFVHDMEEILAAQDMTLRLPSLYTRRKEESGAIGQTS